MSAKKIKLKGVEKAPANSKYKFVAVFEVDRKGVMVQKRVNFGARGYEDFTIHKDPERRDRYIQRHKKDLQTMDPTRAGYLSMYVLWNKMSFDASVRDYKRRLKTYNEKGYFPTTIK